MTGPWDSGPGEPTLPPAAEPTPPRGGSRPPGGAVSRSPGDLVPRPAQARVVVPAPGPGAGNWTGAPSAVWSDGAIWLAYRVRRPLDRGRGVAVVVGRWVDGRPVQQVTRLHRDRFAAESLERPALVRRPDGGWRIYLSCATPGSKHWRVDAVDAGSVEGLGAAEPVTVVPGDRTTGVKDPVVVVDDSGWHAWICCHPLDLPGHEDRMTSRYAWSVDGLTWQDRGEALAPTPGTWDARGTRITAVLGGLDPAGRAAGQPARAVLYDGRRRAADNWHEHTGLALRGPDGRLLARPGPAAAGPVGSTACRYATVVPLPDGRHRLFYELANPDGSHDLVTELR